MTPDPGPWTSETSYRPRTGGTHGTETDESPDRRGGPPVHAGGGAGRVPRDLAGRDRRRLGRDHRLRGLQRPAPSAGPRARVARGAGAGRGRGARPRHPRRRRGGDQGGHPRLLRDGGGRGGIQGGDGAGVAGGVEPPDLSSGERSRAMTQKNVPSFMKGKAKKMPLSEAVKTFIKPGCTLCTGGFSYTRKPFAIGREIVRQNVGGLF